MKRQPLRASCHRQRRVQRARCTHLQPASTTHIQGHTHRAKKTSAQVTAALKPHWCFNISAPYVMSVDRPRTHMKAYLVRPSVYESIGPALDPPQKAPHEKRQPLRASYHPATTRPNAPGARIFDLPLQLISSGIPTEPQTAAQVTAGLKPHWRFNIYAPICGDMHPYEGLPRSTECKRV